MISTDGRSGIFQRWNDEEMGEKTGVVVVFERVRCQARRIQGLENVLAGQQQQQQQQAVEYDSQAPGPRAL